MATTFAAPAKRGHESEEIAMNVSAHLSFNGQCEAAFKFYARILGATTVTMLAYGDSPMAQQVPSEWRSKIVHASLIVGETRLAGADALPADYEQPRGFFILLSVDDPADARRKFQALAENGTVRMSMQTTFWSSAFGVVVDQFGVPWEVSCKQSPSD
jgi:PhnB protein